MQQAPRCRHRGIMPHEALLVYPLGELWSVTPEMKFELLFVPALFAAAPSFSEEYLTVPEAQALIFPGETLSTADFVLDDAQIAALGKMASGPLPRRQVRVWRASSGGWFFLDQVIIKGDRIIFAVGLDASGAVKGVEILACLELYDGIRRAEWRGQFLGKTHGRTELLDQIKSVSGSTLSTNAITTSVKRILATHVLFLASQQP